MSTRPRQPYRDMRRMADLLVERLAPACRRIEIAGSLRRHRPYCSDIELVAIPKAIPNLLGEPSEYTEVDALLGGWPVEFVKRGPKYQQFVIQGTRLPFVVDLFLQPDPATWGINFLLRTGSSEFSRRMVTGSVHGGFKPSWATVRDGRVWCDGAALPTPEEGDVFELWGMGFVEPTERM